MPRQPVPNCACACCVDLRDRLKHQRPILYGCWCHEYTADERCDCAFCVKEQHGARKSETITAESLTDEQIRNLWSTTTDPQIANCCRAALGVGSPIWSIRQCAREAVAEHLNARAKEGT